MKRSDQTEGRPYLGPMRGVIRQISADNFTPILRGPTFAYASRREWIEITARRDATLGRRVARQRNDKQRAREYAYADRSRVCWDTIGYGRALASAGYSTHNGALADMLAPHLRARATDIINAWSAMGKQQLQITVANAAIKFNRSKGSPWYQPGTDREAAYLLALLGRQCRSLTSIKRRLAALSRMGLDLPGVMLKRIQNGRRAVERWIPADLWLELHGEATGLAKWRHIKALPFVLNNLTACFWELLKLARPHIGRSTAAALRLRENKPGAEVHLRRHVFSPEEGFSAGKLFKYRIAWDAPTFDDQVSYETREVWRSELLQPLVAWLVTAGVIEDWRGKLILEFDEEVNDYEFVIPRRTQNERAAVVRSKGRIKSGYRGTSEEGNQIMGALCDESVAWCASRGVVVWAISSGDDSELCSDDDRFEGLLPGLVAHLARHGFVVEVDAVDELLRVDLWDGSVSMERQLERKWNREKAEQARNDVEAAMSIAASHVRLGGIAAGHAASPAVDIFLPELAYICPRLAPACSIASRHTLDEIAGLLAISASHRDPFIDIPEDEWEDEAMVELIEGRVANRLTRGKRTGIWMPPSMPEGALLVEASKRSEAEVDRWLRSYNNTAEHSSKLEIMGDVVAAARDRVAKELYEAGNS